MTVSFSIGLTGFPVGGYYVYRDGQLERFGAPYGQMPKRFRTEDAAYRAICRLIAKEWCEAKRASPSR